MISDSLPGAETMGRNPVPTRSQPEDALSVNRLRRRCRVHLRVQVLIYGQRGFMQSDKQIRCSKPTKRCSMDSAPNKVCGIRPATACATNTWLKPLSWRQNLPTASSALYGRLWTNTKPRTASQVSLVDRLPRPGRDRLRCVHQAFGEALLAVNSAALLLTIPKHRGPNPEGKNIPLRFEPSKSLKKMIDIFAERLVWARRAPSEGDKHAHHRTNNRSGILESLAFSALNS